MARKYRKRYNNKRSIKRMVNQMIAGRQETKHRSVAFAAVGIQDAGRAPSSTHITGVSQGDGATNRTGNQVFLSGLYGKFVVTMTSTDTTNIFRVVLYIPKSAATTMTGINTTDLIDVDQYTILYDRMFPVGAGGPVSRIFTIARKFNKGSRKGITVQYSGPNAADVVKNKMLLYVVSDSTAVPDPTLSGNIRLYFKDA